MLNILSGQATANVKAFPVKLEEVEGKESPIKVIPGTWLKFDTDGTLKVVDEAYDGTCAVFPAYTFSLKQYDNLYLQKIDVVTASSCVLETDVIDGSTFVEGAAVTVDADGKLTANGADATNKVGFVIKVLASGAVQFART